MAVEEKYGISPAITALAFIVHFVSYVKHQSVFTWNDYSSMSLFKSLQMDIMIGMEQREMHRCMDSEQSI